MDKSRRVRRWNDIFKKKHILFFSRIKSSKLTKNYLGKPCVWRLSVGRHHWNILFSSLLRPIYLDDRYLMFTKAHSNQHQESNYTLVLGYLSNVSYSLGIRLCNTPWRSRQKTPYTHRISMRFKISITFISDLGLSNVNLKFWNCWEY